MTDGRSHLRGYVPYRVMSQSGVEYAVDEVNDHVYTVTWRSASGEGKRFARTMREAKRIADNLVLLSNGLTRARR